MYSNILYCSCNLFVFSLKYTFKEFNHGVKLFDMKQLVLLLFSLSVLCGCKSDTKKSSIENETIEEKAIIQLLEPTDFKSAIADSNVQLLDVRTLEEYEEGHIENATRIDFNSEDFKANVQKLDKSKPVYLYCRSGGRSAKASALMAELGFTEIYDLQGGFLAWE